VPGVVGVRLLFRRKKKLLARYHVSCILAGGLLRALCKARESNGAVSVG
jgi:hypothetical protein